MFGIDTFSWYKLITLYEEPWRPLITEIIKTGDFFITHEVKKELEYRFSNYNDLIELVTIFPRLKIDFHWYDQKGFDPADASLIEYCKKGYIIITEDQPMLAEGITEKQNIIQLADYFGLLLLLHFLSKKEYFHLIKKLRDMKNITKKKEKNLLNLRKK